MKLGKLTPGRFYGIDPDGARFEVAVPAAGPDVWVCRRVADYAPGTIPADASVANCEHCAAPLVFNPARTFTAPKHCMQCEGIEPLPMEMPS